MNEDTANGLLNRPLRVMNFGLEKSAEDLSGQDTDLVQLAWSPPAGGNAELARYDPSFQDSTMPALCGETCPRVMADNV